MDCSVNDGIDPLRPLGQLRPNRLSQLPGVGIDHPHAIKTEELRALDSEIVRRCANAHQLRAKSEGLVGMVKCLN